MAIHIKLDDLLHARRLTLTEFRQGFPSDHLGVVLMPLVLPWGYIYRRCGKEETRVLA